MGTVGIANIESTYRARCCVDRNVDVRCDIERAEISEAAAVRDNSAAPVCSVAPVAVGIFGPRSIGIECRRRSGSWRWFRFTTLAQPLLMPEKIVPVEPEDTTWTTCADTNPRKATLRS